MITMLDDAAILYRADKPRGYREAAQLTLAFATFTMIN